MAVLASTTRRVSGNTSGLLADDHSGSVLVDAEPLRSASAACGLEGEGPANGLVWQHDVNNRMFAAHPPTRATVKR